MCVKAHQRLHQLQRPAQLRFLAVQQLGQARRQIGSKQFIRRIKCTAIEYPLQGGRLITQRGRQCISYYAQIGSRVHHRYGRAQGGQLCSQCLPHPLPIGEDEPAPRCDGYGQQGRFWLPFPGHFIKHCLNFGCQFLSTLLSGQGVEHLGHRCAGISVRVLPPREPFRNTISQLFNRIGRQPAGKASLGRGVINCKRLRRRPVALPLEGIGGQPDLAPLAGTIRPAIIDASVIDRSPVNRHALPVQLPQTGQQLRPVAVLRAQAGQGDWVTG